MIKKYIGNYIIRNLITSSLFILGNTSQSSTSLSSEDALNNYKNYNSEKINKKNFNALDEIVRKDSSLYSGKIKTEYSIEQNLSFEYFEKNN